MAYHLYRFGSSQVLPQGDPQDDVAGADVSSDAIPIAAGTHYAYGTGIIPLRRHMIAHRGIYSTNVETNVDALMGLLGQRKQLWRYRESDDAIQWKYAKMLSCRWRRVVDQRSHAVVDCQFEAEGNWSAQSGFSTSRASTGDLTIANAGDAYIWNGTLTFTSSATNSKTIRVQITALGVDFTWTGTVDNTKVLTISGAAMAVDNDGADAYSGLTLNAGHTAQRWLMFAPGNNTVTITYSGGAGTTAVAWFDQWI